MSTRVSFALWRYTIGGDFACPYLAAIPIYVWFWYSSFPRQKSPATSQTRRLCCSIGPYLDGMIVLTPHSSCITPSLLTNYSLCPPGYGLPAQSLYFNSFLAAGENHLRHEKFLQKNMSPQLSLAQYIFRFTFVLEINKSYEEFILYKSWSKNAYVAIVL